MARVTFEVQTGRRDGISGREDVRVTIDRAALRRVLLDEAPWLAEHDHGPQAVTAGTCDRCHERPRLLPACGPTPYEALCRTCAEDEGDHAWCDGHLEEGRSARRWADDLPDRWADIVVLWWVATGEVRLATMPTLIAPDELPASVRALLSGG